jgi:hypothetical protein
LNNIKLTAMKNKVLMCGLLMVSAISLPASAQILWQQCYGGSSLDQPSAIRKTFDGGYIVVGATGSVDGDVSGSHGDYDIWVVKISATGSIEWQRCYGGSQSDGASDIQQTTDGGYIIAGSTTSDDQEVTGKHGTIWDGDYWIVKISPTGGLEWEKCENFTRGNFRNRTNEPFIRCLERGRLDRIK